MTTYFEATEDLIKYLENDLGFTEDDAFNSLDELTDYEEEPWKRSTRCSGYLHDPAKDYYYHVEFLADYDWGNSQYQLTTTPVKREEYEETTVVKKVRYLPV